MLPIYFCVKILYYRKQVFQISCDKNEDRKIEKAMALFKFTDGHSIFVIKLIEKEKIIYARRILNDEEKERIHVRGTIIKKAADYNPNWNFHLDPKSIDFFEFAIEVCDASINFVEQNLHEIGNSTLPNCQWCPWSSKIVEEIESN
jgi:hypothetical protein